MRPREPKYSYMKMSMFQLKITCHPKQQEDLKLKKVIDANVKMTEMLKLPDKDYKASMIKIPQLLIVNKEESTVNYFFKSNYLTSNVQLIYNYYFLKTFTFKLIQPVY